MANEIEAVSGQASQDVAAAAARLAAESIMLDEARADVAAGRVIPDIEVDAWLNRLVQGEPLPLPDARPSNSHV